MTAPSPVPEQPTAPASEPQRPRRPRVPLRGVLTGLLAAVSVLALAVVALDVIVWVRTTPTPVATGPDVTVSASVGVKNGIATATLVLPASTDAITVASDSKTWVKTLHFGEAIQLSVVLTGQGMDDDTGVPGNATCRLTGSNDKVLQAATVSVQNGTATCLYTNDGKG